MFTNTLQKSLGAIPTVEGVYFRVWAPKCKTVAVLLEHGDLYPLMPEEGGYFSGLVSDAEVGALYWYQLDGGSAFPDPTSRFQPQGPHGPSQVIDPLLFQWSDTHWKGIVDPAKVVLYELHVGTFTEAGTWHDAMEKLSSLADLGINVIEMMPINEWAGRFNWGYDGVNLYAPTHNYGCPNDLKAFINAAHQLNIGVILDVVYNHFGPDGNYLHHFSDFYTKQEESEWGSVINFDESHSENVREFFILNAGYWIEEFHFDGLRLDACHSIQDTSSTHILLEITKQVREKSGKRSTYVIGENEKQQVQYLLPEQQGGYALNAIWDEDFHHSAFVRLTGRREAYFSDYCGTAREFVSALKYNFLYQGQWYSWQKQIRGEPALNFPHYRFINFLENHDQISNTGSALRLQQLSHAQIYRAMTALFLLSPQIPLLFQGQEFGSLSPFYYFCDHNPELAQKVSEGRLKFIAQFKSMSYPKIQKMIPLPHDESTFHLSKLNWSEKEAHHCHFQLHKDLLELRKNDPVFGNLKEVQIDGVALNHDAFVIRYFSKYGERLLLINFGIDFLIDPPSEPLLAPPSHCTWNVMWTSEQPEYGGFGYLKIPQQEHWKITGFSAYIFHPEEI